MVIHWGESQLGSIRYFFLKLGCVGGPRKIHSWVNDVEIGSLGVEAIRSDQKDWSEYL